MVKQQDLKTLKQIRKTIERGLELCDQLSLNLKMAEIEKDSGDCLGWYFGYALVHLNTLEAQLQEIKFEIKQ